LLKALRIKPSAVFIFEINEEESKRRLNNRRIDPITGVHYNLEVNPPSDEQTSTRMIEFKEDNEAVIEKKCGAWKNSLPLVEESFRSQIQNV